jgi:transposase-like protein
MSKNIENKELTFELKEALKKISLTEKYLPGTKKLSKQNEIDIIENYVNKDISMSELASIYKVSQKTIAKVIRKNNIKTKYKGFQTKILSSDKEEIEKLYKKGYSIVDISKKFQVATTTIDYILNELKVSDRSDNFISSKEKREVVDLYLNKFSIDDISEKFNISHRKIYTILRENNLDAPKKEKRSDTRLIKPEDHNTIITLYKKGLGCWKIGKLLQIDHSTIAEFLKRSGVELRKLSWKLKKDESKPNKISTTIKLDTKNSTMKKEKENTKLLRKRGRPKKEVAVAETTNLTLEKRKRGRPKKEVAIVETTNLTLEKRKRGRPKKEVAIVETTNLTLEKRKRGRPKKEVAIVEKKIDKKVFLFSDNVVKKEKVALIDIENASISTPVTFNLLGININLNNSEDKNYEFTDVKEITVNPSRVYRISLNAQTLEKIPEVIFKCQNLESLNVRNNYIADIEGKIKLLSKLKELDVGENTITILPDDICSLINLTLLKVDQNYLSELPILISHLKNLEVLNANFNKIMRFNEGITKLSNLRELYLDNNEISRVSLHIGNMSNLKKLDLNHNKLGTLPPKIGLLDNLTYLNLKMNELEIIPDEFSNLKNLTFLDISDNYVKVPSKKVLSLFEEIEEFYADDKILKKIKPIEK